MRIEPSSTKQVAHDRRCVHLLFGDDVFTQPRHEFVEGELAAVVERKQEILRPLAGTRELCAVDREKRIGGGKGGAFIAVEESAVLGQTLPKGRG